MHIFFYLYPSVPSVLAGQRSHFLYLCLSHNPRTLCGHAAHVRDDHNYRIGLSLSDVYGIARPILRQLSMSFEL
jgi:hypothetical protein